MQSTRRVRLVRALLLARSLLQLRWRRQSLSGSCSGWTGTPAKRVSWCWGGCCRQHTSGAGLLDMAQIWLRHHPNKPTAPSPPPWFFLAAYLRLHTSLGDLNIELHCDLAPRTCENFLGLCEMGYYNDTIFHRSIKNFMIQVGRALQ